MKMPMKEVPVFQCSRGDGKQLKRGISGVYHTVSNLFASKISKRQQFTTEYRRAREYFKDICKDYKDTILCPQCDVDMED
ncbi:uncharacterized protein LOC143226241 isoform X3 [Tachypleus tridentatus]|uniref:uncharacterized protein LOC143226241 isoform X3 n=1 Tax=Tachypleus tridentatus TaxID=6853 RepID=UPI003FD48403